MASTFIPPDDFDLIEGAVNGDSNSKRVLYQNFSQNIQRLFTALGLTTQNAKNVPTPPQGAIAVSGSNGAFNYAITPGASSSPAVVYHRVSYSPTKTFQSGVVTLPWSSATSGVVNAPGKNMFFRLESSYNMRVANQPILHGQSAVDSGLISSAAIADGAAFAQTNLMTVTSSQGSGTAAIHIQGAGGTLTAGVALKGGVQTLLPPATIIGNALGSNNFVGYDGNNYQVKPTLGAVLLDSLRPVGKVIVPGQTTPGQDGGGGSQAGNGGRLSAV